MKASPLVGFDLDPLSQQTLN